MFPIIGKTVLSEVTREDLEAIVLSLDEKVVRGDIAWKTAANTWGVVTSMFNDAKRSKSSALRVRTDDPTRDVEPPETGEPKAKQFLYPKAFLQLLECDSIWNASGQLVARAKFARRWMRLFALAIYLELRQGELRALRWTDIEFDHWICSVHKAVKRVTGGKRIRSRRRRAGAAS